MLRAIFAERRSRVYVIFCHLLGLGLRFGASFLNRTHS
jgi:hypothetical protein